MICPKCKGRTEVLETTQRDAPVTRRRRRCMGCAHRFTTTEVLMDAQRVVIGADLAHAVRKITGRSKQFDAEAIAAAIRVDRRKAQIAREQRERDRDDEHAAPRRLAGSTLRRELKGY